MSDLYEVLIEVSGSLTDADGNPLDAEGNPIQPAPEEPDTEEKP